MRILAGTNALAHCPNVMRGARDLGGYCVERAQRLQRYARETLASGSEAKHLQDLRMVDGLIDLSCNQTRIPRRCFGRLVLFGLLGS